MNWFKSSRKKESEDYEKEFLSRYKKQQKAKPEKKASKHKKVIEIESDEKNQDGEIKILKKEPEPLSTKFNIQYSKGKSGPAKRLFQDSLPNYPFKRSWTKNWTVY